MTDVPAGPNVVPRCEWAERWLSTSRLSSYLD